MTNETETTTTAKHVAELFHENYERLALEFGYKTREASAVPWSDVPDNNRLLMEATSAAVCCALGVPLNDPADSDDYLVNDAVEFANAADHVRAYSGPFLVEFFGERCRDFEPECECCKRWAAFDVLIENPFDEGTSR